MPPLDGQIKERQHRLRRHGYPGQSGIRGNHSSWSELSKLPWHTPLSTHAPARTVLDLGLKVHETITPFPANCWFLLLSLLSILNRLQGWDQWLCLKHFYLCQHWTEVCTLCPSRQETSSGPSEKVHIPERTTDITLYLLLSCSLFIFSRSYHSSARLFNWVRNTHIKKTKTLVCIFAEI